MAVMVNQSASRRFSIVEYCQLLVGRTGLAKSKEDNRFLLKWFAFNSPASHQGVYYIRRNCIVCTNCGIVRKTYKA